ncbi:F510_1955 family glycosylhydrolase [Lentzea sp. NPDC005914]|uniref:F510_1955 family glycosylhydrolase n=1 Tax=Lentzea sp. NPDC005914 TaxID=3154572 RepID=UPI00340B3C07
MGPAKALATSLPLLLLVACSGAQPSSSPTPTGMQGEAPATLAHVHGLGVDPADGTLYAASHFGVFKLVAGRDPERVGERAQDTMGFAVVGPNHFLGSGHPDRREASSPPHLGLIESTDAGETWRTLSLEGAADFHALQTKHSRVYGYNSQNGQLMVSEDLQNWDIRARVPIVDFAVSPDSPDVLLATTEQGVVRSTDGGRTFSSVAGSPRLLLLDWPAAGTVTGVAPDGTVQVSRDSAATWTAGGRVTGSPGALATNGEAEVFVATESAIHASTDGGKTFTVRQPLR